MFLLTRLVLSVLDNQSDRNCQPWVSCAYPFTLLEPICVMQAVVCLSLSLTVHIFQDCHSASIPGLLFIPNEFIVCVNVLPAYPHLCEIHPYSRIMMWVVAFPLLLFRCGMVLWCKLSFPPLQQQVCCMCVIFLMAHVYFLWRFGQACRLQSLISRFSLLRTECL